MYKPSPLPLQSAQYGIAAILLLGGAVLFVPRESGLLGLDIWLLLWSAVIWSHLALAAAWWSWGAGDWAPRKGLFLVWVVLAAAAGSAGEPCLFMGWLFAFAVQAATYWAAAHICGWELRREEAAPPWTSLRFRLRDLIWFTTGIGLGLGGLKALADLLPDLGGDVLSLVILGSLALVNLLAVVNTWAALDGRPLALLIALLASGAVVFGIGYLESRRGAFGEGVVPVVLVGVHALHAIVIGGLIRRSGYRLVHVARAESRVTRHGSQHTALPNSA